MVFHGCSWRIPVGGGRRCSQGSALLPNPVPTVPGFCLQPCSWTWIFGDFSCSEGSWLSSVPPRLPRVLPHSCPCHGNGNGNWALPVSPRSGFGWEFMNELQGDKFRCSCPLFREKDSGGLGKPLTKDGDGKGDGKGNSGWSSENHFCWNCASGLSKLKQLPRISAMDLTGKIQRCLKSQCPGGAWSCSRGFGDLGEVGSTGSAQRGGKSRAMP